MVPWEGLEPSIPCENAILSRARIPFRHHGKDILRKSTMFSEKLPYQWNSMKQGLQQMAIAFSDHLPGQCAESEFQALVGRGIEKMISTVQVNCATAITEWDGNYTGSMTILECDRAGAEQVMLYFQNNPKTGRILQ